jgi:hypothetical protein
VTERNFHIRKDWEAETDSADEETPRPMYAARHIQCQADRRCPAYKNSRAAVLRLRRAGGTKAEDAADVLGYGS